MEVAEMEESKKLEEAKMTSAAAFVEGGIQDACEDACSICLEDFCESDPSTVTGCKHEFHLQCILEWCQRSSQCPMCWQPISLKDPTSQELLDAVVEERNLRLNPPRNAAIFHHPALGEFEIQHLPVGVNDAELEERIIQHLAAAAAMGRARHFARREGHRGRSSAQGRPQFLVFSAHPNNQSGPPASPERVQGESAPAGSVVADSPSRIGEETFLGTSSSNQSTQRDVASFSGASTLAAGRASPSSNGRSPSQSSPRSQDRAGPSDLQSFSETLKSRLNAMSMRYKESLSKSTRGWKERWFSRNSSMSDTGSEVRTEANAGIATVSGQVERIDIRGDERSNNESTSINPESNAQSPDTGTHLGEESRPGSEGNHLADNHTQAPCTTQSGSV